MLGNFTYYNPCRLHFGPDAVSKLADELAEYGPSVVLVYGGGSIKRSGLYDQVTTMLRAAGKTVAEISGVMSNPTADKLREGAKVARDANADLLLAVGGGSVIDYAKAVAVSAWCDDDPWEKYFLRMEAPDNRLIPVGNILTMSGTGSEMNAGSVISNPQQKLKIGHVFGPELIPRFAIVNPELTFTVPDYQMRAGIFDAFNHIQEQYFSGDDDNTSDYVAEALMRSLVTSSLVAVADPADYEARSNISWVCTWALNTLLGKGKATDWEVHMIGQAIGAVTDAAHGMTLSAVAPAYYRHIMPYGLHKFVRFAVEVWDVRPEGKTDEQVAREGIEAMEAWMDRIGVVRHVGELGLTPDMYDDVVKGTFLLEGGYKKLTPDEVRAILVASA
ncbi:iron-containing alcohol dehydrogenase [Eggerthellaceae bacterium zg-1084]|uniref:iron-containing alcohol dehydrogenase n=1 Tax=Berryella wangjianweii TaxID=2734634 RepID=UPI0015581B47|nr:iron-containing alcohol dehydrogenase [Berryella wangjianweii]NPD30406.1 iron-containing alcohol dehydrogenase [Berryella wangjianweii]